MYAPGRRVLSVADAVFEEPRLAEIYDPLDPDRCDLDAYAAMAEEFGARSVLDVGCGTWRRSSPPTGSGQQRWRQSARRCDRGAGWCSRAGIQRRRHGWSGTATRPTAMSSYRGSALCRPGSTWPTPR